ncbi:MAG: hypothetical protein PW734_00970 [Verrucomicrobium sp.]|nr:hypothetical protein [Verrucomicrobium sp.]
MLKLLLAGVLCGALPVASMAAGYAVQGQTIYAGMSSVANNGATVSLSNGGSYVVGGSDMYIGYGPTGGAGECTTLHDGVSVNVTYAGSGRTMSGAGPGWFSAANSCHSQNDSAWGANKIYDYAYVDVSTNYGEAGEQVVTNYGPYIQVGTAPDPQEQMPNVSVQTSAAGGILVYENTLLATSSTPMLGGVVTGGGYLGVNPSSSYGVVPGPCGMFIDFGDCPTNQAPQPIPTGTLSLLSGEAKNGTPVSYHWSVE